MSKAWRRSTWAGASILALVGGAFAVLCLTTGCSSPAYLWQAAGGHLQLLGSARPVDEWLADPQTSLRLKERLLLSQRLRDFAVHELKLPDNRSYRAYAELGRPAAVWNVVAAPELSLGLKTWCFPVVGCVAYRGYYQLADAKAAAEALRQAAAPTVLDVSVYPVPAYSTLGMSDWLGGDPLLSSFLSWPEGELARLIFHELSHQKVYAAGDTPFNEAFATAVERLGAERWLSVNGSAAAQAEYKSINARRLDVRLLLGRYREALETMYRSAASDAAKRESKQALLAAMRREQATLKSAHWNGYAGYDAYFRDANNATLGVQAAYDGLVPAFDALFDREQRSFPRFYAEAQRLAALPKPTRDDALRALMTQPRPSARWASASSCPVSLEPQPSPCQN